jgi:bleomycin hydrolase
MRQHFFLTAAIAVTGMAGMAQPGAKTETGNGLNFTILKTVAATPVKDQAATGTCWCFSTTSLLESQCLRANSGPVDLSEMFTVRNIYIEKARNYILRQGHAQFSEGGLGHDVIRATAAYGAMPEAAYSGMRERRKQYNHTMMFAGLKKYLDSLLNTPPIAADWMTGYKQILDETMGVPPADFTLNGKKYTPLLYAKEVLKFNPADYVNITSFTHHPFYTPFILEAPDNFSNGAYYNLPLEEMIQVVKDALNNGYSVMWDADVSNNWFMQGKGLAVFPGADVKPDNVTIGADMQEAPWNAALRQQLYENLTTQDDHLMHIIGVEKSKTGKTYFLVKNSWGKIGPQDGYINVSEAYFAINTVSLVIPKAAISKALLDELQIK